MSTNAMKLSALKQGIKSQDVPKGSLDICLYRKTKLKSLSCGKRCQTVQ